MAESDFQRENWERSEKFGLDGVPTTIAESKLVDIKSLSSDLQR